MRNQTIDILLLIFLGEIGGFLDEIHFGFGNNHIVFTKRNTRAAGFAEADLHNVVAKQHGFFLPAVSINGVDDLGNFFLGHQLVNRLIRQIDVLRQLLGENKPARRGIDNAREKIALGIHFLDTRFDFRVQGHGFLVERMFQFGNIGNQHALARSTIALQGHVIKTQHDILRRHDNRCAICRMQNIIGRHHQHARFQLRFER